MKITVPQSEIENGHFWQEPAPGMEEFWAFVWPVRAKVGDPITFNLDRKPIAEAVISRIEKPGESQCAETDRFLNRWKVYWSPQSFKKVEAKEAAGPVAISPSGKYKDFVLSIEKAKSYIGTPMVTVRARYEGTIIGYVTFANLDGVLDPMSVDITEAYRRQGLATAMYVFAERKTKQKIKPSNAQTPDGKSLWQQEGRPFGRSAATKIQRDVPNGYFWGRITESDDELMQKLEEYELDEIPEQLAYVQGHKVAFLDFIEAVKAGKGTGNKLLEAFEADARQAGAVAAVLLADAERDQKKGFELVQWYERHGYVKVEKIYYDWLMAKRLNATAPSKQAVKARLLLPIS